MPKTATDKANNDATNNTGNNQPNNNPKVFFVHVKAHLRPHHPSLEHSYLKLFVGLVDLCLPRLNGRWFRCSELRHLDRVIDRLVADVRCEPT